MTFKSKRAIFTFRTNGLGALALVTHCLQGTKSRKCGFSRVVGAQVSHGSLQPSPFVNLCFATIRSSMSNAKIVSLNEGSFLPSFFLC